jgi:hypothetical protein
VSDGRTAAGYGAVMGVPRRTPPVSCGVLPCVAGMTRPTGTVAASAQYPSLHLMPDRGIRKAREREG